MPLIPTASIGRLRLSSRDWMSGRKTILSVAFMTILFFGRRPGSVTRTLRFGHGVGNRVRSGVGIRECGPAVARHALACALEYVLSSQQSDRVEAAGRRSRRLQGELRDKV